MQGKERIAVQPLGICRRLYNFARAILSSRALPSGLSQGHSSNNGDVKIEFSGMKNGKERGVGQEALQRGNAENDINVKIKFKSYGKQAQRVEPSFANEVREGGGTRRVIKGSSKEGKQKHGKETSTHKEEGDEDAIAIFHRERIPSRVFSDIDTRADDFIRSRLEAMRRSH